MAQVLLSIGLLLLAAKIGEGLARRIHQSSIVAYLLAGVLLGPILNVVQPTTEPRLFFTVGIIFLFFLIGIDELDIPGFLSTLRGRFFLAGTVAFAVPLAGALGVTYYGLGMPLAVAVIVSGILALTSLGVVARVLSEHGHLREPLGIEIFAVVAILALLGLLFVAVVLGQAISGDAFSGWNTALLLVRIAAFTLVSWLIGSRLLPFLLLRLRRVFNVPELAFGVLVGVLLLMVAAAGRIGLHESLGALFFGAALAGIPHRLRHEVMPGIRSMAHGLFIPLFFASAGLYLDLSFLSLPITTVLSLVMVTVFGKMAGAMLAAQIVRMGPLLPLASSLMAKGAAETALLLVMLEAGLLGRELFSLLVAMMAVFMVVVPPVMTAAIAHPGRKGRQIVPKRVLPSLARFALDDVKVGQIMDKSRRFPFASLSLADFTEQWMVPEQNEYLVLNGSGELVGVFTLHDLHTVPRARWQETKLLGLVRDSPTPVSPDHEIGDVVERMAEESVSVLPVVDPQSGKFLGDIRHKDIYAVLSGGNRR